VSLPQREGGRVRALSLHAQIVLEPRPLEARKAAGKPTDNPNIVMNAAVQVCWEKAARYLEVEERYWYCSADKYCLDPQEAVDLCDENTIMVCAILGSTYTGEYEDVQTLNDLLMKKNEAEGLNVHIHVDAASGGFVAPFVKPDLVWDFRLPLVCGINVSGHKYGSGTLVIQYRS
jgi:glutamate decarboxylase